MVRIFSILSAFAFIVILSVGAGIYLISANQIKQSKHDSAAAVAKSVALAIYSQINLLSNSLDKMAQDPEVLAAVTSGDTTQLTNMASKLEKHLSGVLKIRLLLPGVSELDDKSIPKMGYADLDMVRETFTKNQFPAVQGDNGPDRHLAITRRIMQNGQAVGVILASLNYDFIGKVVQSADIDGYIELKQAALVLGVAGKPVDTEPNTHDDQRIAIDNTRWEIFYQFNANASPVSLSFIIGIIVLSALLILLALFFGYRTLSNTLTQDLACILKAYKDLMTNKIQQGSYPVKLSEMNAVVSTLVQFKRVLDSEDEDFNTSGKVDYTLDGFFNDSDDFVSEINTNPLKTDNQHKEPVSNAVKIGSVNPSSEPGQKVAAKPEIVEKTVPDCFEMTPSISPKKVSETDSLFRAYDIRGIVSKALTKEIVFDIGRALGTKAKEHDIKIIVIARDGRTSSPSLSDALAKGIITTGINVLDIGMVPTPVLYFVARHTEGRSGIMITGSHNPADYNGLKMVINGETLANEKIQQLKTIINEQSYFKTKPIGSIEQNNLFTQEYIGIISEDIRVSRPLTVVLDCGNGVAGELGPLLLKTLGCQVIELFCDIDGTFPNHHPDPSNPKNLIELITSVKHYKADLGIAFDGDGDRLGVVDSSGKIIWPDRQMMLFAKDVLSGKPGAEIIYDVKCSRHLAEQISKHGGTPTMWKTGHSLMKAKLKETGAKLAGEMSGHIFFNDRWFGFDDALYSAARLIEILSKDSRSSAEVFADFPDSINTPELNVALNEGENFSFIEKLTAAAKFSDAKIITIDGLRVDFQDGWGLVRASNTTPSLVLRFEADNESALRRIQEQFKQLMTKIKPDIVLPF